MRARLLPLFAPSEPAAATPELEARLQALVSTAAQAWPSFTISSEDLVRYAAERAAPQGELAARVEAVHWTDLYLACGCNSGEPAALLAFENAYVAQVPKVVSSLRLPAADVEDVKQIVRERLLSPTAEGRRRIASYSGKGPLWSWFKICAQRDGLALAESTRKRETQDIEHLVPGASMSPELQMLKRRHAAEFKLAFAEALANLPVEERNLLRQYFLDKLTFEELGTIFGVNRSTVLRRLEKAQDHLVATLRDRMRAHLKLSNTELDSLLGLIRTEIGASLVAQLKPPEKP